MIVKTSTVDKRVPAQIIDIACPCCDARVGERCSDTEVFVRDTAFHRERQKAGDE